MYKRKVRKEPIDFIFPDGAVQVQPTNGEHWTKKTVGFHLKLAGIEYPLYTWEFFEKNKQQFVKLYCESTSVIMSYDFFMKYVFPIENEFDCRLDKQLRLEEMANDGKVFWQPSYAIQLITSCEFKNSVKFVQNDNEIFTARRKDDDKTIEIMNSEGRTVDIGIDEIIDDIKNNDLWTFANFDFNLLVEEEIAFYCENGFKKAQNSTKEEIEK